MAEKQTPLTKEQIPEVQQHMMEYLVQRKPYIIKLEDELQKVDNGVVTVELRVKDGFVTDLLTTAVKRHTFKQSDLQDKT